MQELSLNILDIAENSVKAGADRIVIDIEENGSSMKICIADNGKGMDEPTVQRLTDPFYTTRTTRKVGMGVPLFQMAAEQTGGSLRVESIQAPAPEHGTRVTAEFHTDTSTACRWGHCLHYPDSDPGESGNQFYLSPR